MIYYLLLMVGGVTLLFLPALQKKKTISYLKPSKQTVVLEHVVATDQQAVNLKSLTEQTFFQKVETSWDNFTNRIGKYPLVKIIIFELVAYFVISSLISYFFRSDSLVIVLPLMFIVSFWMCVWLKQREERIFEESFPDVLNMLASSVSAGESIMHAIAYVGRSQDNDLGNEFRLMAERMKIGESPDDVFRKACLRFPYPSFYFFIITLRANLDRGGQLKEVMTRINRLMFDARAINKKKYALTSEARMSAKIVAAIPFAFLFLLQYISPENYDFVMFNERGKPILYYVLLSEFIGILIVWLLMKRVS
ncbi:type II secretion system F family protein [Vibrio sp. D404a]|uniref:type II secretion system F family protein n=1 Tax=unclassified Vibrio TaxID=2614977 RepID=UPI002552B2ED|nr:MULTISPECIES: type II secretion system F family protein [unclassified Vibrio]MDK9738693.1 type II secretion system F family protein [Vibrio sp. D404a]MDK9795495.1 type II secretion system F family protein [Vibrio sp. D449a]